MEYINDVSFLVGKVLKSVEQCYDSNSGDEIRFTLDNGRVFRLCHRQDCCESVGLEETDGDLQNLVGAPIFLADERTSDTPPDNDPDHKPYDELEQWTFYRFATVKGYCNLRWYGTSNGYYSVGVDFEEVR